MRPSERAAFVRWLGSPCAEAIVEIRGAQDLTTREETKRDRAGRSELQTRTAA